MLPYAIAGGMAALSLLGGASQNAQTAARAREAGKRTYATLNTQIANIREQSIRTQQEIGLEATAEKYKAMARLATTGASLADRGIAGNTAAKAYGMKEMESQMIANVMKKKAEDAALTANNQMYSMINQANDSLFGIQQQAQAQTIGTIQAISGAVQAGASGYMLGSAIEKG